MRKTKRLDGATLRNVGQIAPCGGVPRLGQVRAKIYMRHTDYSTLWHSGAFQLIPPGQVGAVQIRGSHEARRPHEMENFLVLFHVPRN